VQPPGHTGFRWRSCHPDNTHPKNAKTIPGYTVPLSSQLSVISAQQKRILQYSVPLSILF
jgi:hypothetical protein